VRRFAPQLFAPVFGIAVLLFSVLSALAQTTGRPTSQQQVQNREWSRAHPERANFGNYERELERARIAMRNDFRQLQLVNNQLMLRVFRPTLPETQKITNKEIRSSLGEIKKLAERLRLNFGFAKLKPAFASELELAKGLDRLDDAVMSFVNNPMFQQPRVYDVELATKAEKDIGEVLELTEALRKLTQE